MKAGSRRRSINQTTRGVLIALPMLDAGARCEDYFQWYNHQHHHSGLAGFTPEQVFTGRYTEAAQQKQQALDERFALNPERFVKGRPTAKLPPNLVAINPVKDEQGQLVADHVNFPTLTIAGYEAVK